MRQLPVRLLISTLFWLAANPSARASSVYDPILRFRTISTEHFVIYFHQREEPLAARLAVIAENTWRAMGRPLGTSPPARTHVVLVDQTELSNGFATPIPYNMIVVTATWPAGSDFIGKTDDWLRLVFTHEFTHIVHLDRSEAWARVLRGIFGRTPAAFPNLFLPTWHVEGLATYEESAMSGGREGRLHAGDFRLIVDEAARAKQLEPLDRVNGGLTDWPGGLGPYAYGAGFHEYLARRFGEASFAELAKITARRVPFTASRAFLRVYGESLGALWRDYQASLAAAASSPLAGARATQLTHHGFAVSGPRFDRSPCGGCANTVVYSVRTPHEFPSLYQVTVGRSPQRLASRYLGSTNAIDRDAVYFDQLELRRNTGLYSDLYALDRRTRKVRQLTKGARLLDPDLSPDGRTLVCVREATGRRDLVLVSGGALAARSKSSSGSQTAESQDSLTIDTLISEPETQFDAPRWSPDGRTIAVERHAPGHQSEIVIVDVSSRAVRTVASDPRARFVTPAWRPDGRAIVAAADLDEGPFDLYEVETTPVGGVETARSEAPAVRRLTHESGGATWPDVSPDGNSIVFVGYTTDGFDLFTLPYPASGSGDRSSATTAGESREGSRQSRLDAAYDPTTARDYNPAATLAPTSWSPVVAGDSSQLRVGFALSGGDVLGYHAYSVSATWLASSRTDAPTPSATRPDWQLSYQYDRWRPTLFLSASSDTSFFSGPADERGVPTAATLREQEIEAGLLFPVRHVRVAHTSLVSFVRGIDDLQLPDRLVSPRRAAWRAGWAIGSAHTYGYSISPEGGTVMGMTADVARRVLGASGDATTVTFDGRLYVSPFVRHQVLAVRFAAGAASGDPVMRQTFLLGGAQSNPSTLDFGRSAISLLRGFGSSTFAGSHVALVNADYRWPIARPQRGHGTWPIFWHTVHAAAFADIGHAWTRTFDTRDLKTSVGGELSFDLIGAYFARFTTTIGAAWGRDGSHAVPDRGTVYVRLGRAF